VSRQDFFKSSFNAFIVINFYLYFVWRKNVIACSNAVTPNNHRFCAAFLLYIHFYRLNPKTQTSEKRLKYSARERPTVCVTGAGAGVDNVWEQKKLEARKMLENAAESPASSARFVGLLFILQAAFDFSIEVI